MSELIPIAVVILALVAAGSIIYVAWELTSKDIHEVLERSLGQRGAGERKPDGSSCAESGNGEGPEEPGLGEPRTRKFRREGAEGAEGPDTGDTGKP